MTLASIVVGPMQFDEPVWLIGIPVLSLLAWWMGRRSLSGLGPVTRWCALGVRLLVIAMLLCVLAEPQWRREAKDVAVTVVVDSSDSIPTVRQQELEAFIAESVRAQEGREDRLGVVTTAKDAYVQALPSRLTRQLERQHIGVSDGTNLAGGVRLALAVKPNDAAYRIVVASDGNQTLGNLLQAAEAAKALGVPIDVLPMRYKYDSEVLVDRLVAPASAREGETLNLRVVLQATAPTRGRLTILMNGSPVDIDPDSEGFAAMVDLRTGQNVLSVPVKALSTGPQRFESSFEPLVVGGRQVGDSLPQNNRSLAVTFVSGEGKVLVLIGEEETAAAGVQDFVAALTQANMKVEVRTSATAPATLTDFNAYDAIVLFNLGAYGFSQQQQEDLRQYVHDSGGGLLMVGGPNAFGAGGWIGSPLEDALPMQLDPPQKRQMPRGALALIVHSVEAPDGVFLGKKVCESAVNALSRLDMVGIVEYGWGGDTSWVHPIEVVGDGTKVKRSVQNLMFGDMPDFTPSVELALQGLNKVDAGQKHVIIISDGDPSPPSSTLLDKYRASGVTMSTVGVYPHSGGDTSRMEWMSKYTGGRHYHIDTAAGLASIPQIFIKEAQTVRRSLIWEGTAFSPAFIGGSEAMRGISSVPPVSGYVVTAEREGLAQTTLKGKEGDPIMAQWQYGLGRVVGYTSDASRRWNANWIPWQGYRQFWEQHVRWVLRPSGSANLRVVTESKGDQTVVTVEALDSKGERLNFANFRARLAKPGGGGVDVDLRQVGPGRYQGVATTDQSGSYVLSMRFAAPDANVEGGVLEGSAQAAISRPFADEFRALEDNAALLTQVAEMTGGRVLTWDTRRDSLWTRDGLTMPVSTRSIMLWLAAAAVALFLMDVGVRRVRIDVPAMWRSVLAGFGMAPPRDVAQMGSLRAAREKAQAKMVQRGSGDGARADTRADTRAADLEREARQAAIRAAQAAASVSNVKFEASAEQVKAQGRGNAPSIALGGADARVEKQAGGPPALPNAPGGAGKQQAAPGEGMNRLLKAKQKARDDMQEGT
jgi:uncharacterized membrane protein